MKILVAYYSRTGNTEKMAEAAVEGVRTTGSLVELLVDSDVDPATLSGYDAVVVGAPTYHHDMTNGIKSLFEKAAVKGVNLNGKVGAAFGSYGWSGEAPRLVLEIMKNRFGMRVIEPPLLVKYKPDSQALSRCRELGIAIAKSI